MPEDMNTGSSLVYLAGTMISKEVAEQHLSLGRLKEKGHTISVANGVGTVDNLRLERKLKSKGSASNENEKKASTFLEGIATFKDKGLGYKEGTHLVQSESMFNAIQPDTKNLVIAGHSRGAAVGVTGIITQMYAEALAFKEQKDKGEKMSEKFLANIDKISLIALDPVVGGGPIPGVHIDTNNHLGLGKDNARSTPSISEMLNTISEVAEKPDLFDVTAVLARYDGRSKFKLDDRWKEFIDQNKGVNCDVYHAGFQHSEMALNKELYNNALSEKEKMMVLDIYEKDAKPTDFIHAKIAQKLGPPKNATVETQQTLDDKTAELAEKVQKTELTEINNMRGNKSSKVVDFTGKGGYVGIRKFMVSGSILDKLPSNNGHGRTIDAENQVRTEAQKNSKTKRGFILPPISDLQSAINEADNALALANAARFQMPDTNKEPNANRRKGKRM